MLVWYSVWNLVKFGTVASYLLVCALSTHSEIGDYYTTTKICTACYLKAVAQPSVYFEFTECKASLTPALTGDNLLYDRGFWSFSLANSPVPSMVWTTATILGFLGVVYLCVVWFSWFLTRNRDRPEHANAIAENDRFSVIVLTTLVFEISSLFVIILLSVSQTVLGLDLVDGCYISPWNRSQLIASTVVYTITITIWLADIAAMQCGGGGIRILCFCCTRLGEVTWYITAIALATINAKEYNAPIQLIVNVALIISLADVFCLLNDLILGLRGARGRGGGNARPPLAGRSDFLGV